ncbi:MAG: L,D-transpeptidase family protein, partial [Chitinophagaceae bacterium]
MSLLLSLFLFSACNNPVRPPATDIAATPEELGKKITEHLQQSLEFAAGNDGRIDDTVSLALTILVQQAYDNTQFSPVWTAGQDWGPLADSLLHFISNGRLYGLYPDDYHLPALLAAQEKIRRDSLGRRDRKDAVLWAHTELMLTDAFFHLVKDLKLGRLPQDSVTLRKDSVLPDEFYQEQLARTLQGRALVPVLAALEPAHQGYRRLKAAIPAFLDSADNRTFTRVPAPSQRSPDFKTLLQKRLFESGFITFDSTAADSAQLAEAVKKFQRSQGITIDGKAGDATVRMLNVTDRDRFARIAITLDRYKLLPEQLPSRYVWVNLPGFYMNFWENDTLQLVSKIICGKPATRTPLLNSAISELVTYPQWTVPQSIIAKEILPAVKKDPGYLARKGFSLVNAKGEEVDPFTVDWSKYSKGIPYRVVQGSGDANALGVLKFNFPNKYAVYLHDTNQRSLFALTTRTLSHGCVRVQDWQKLAYSIVRYDNRDRVEEGPSPSEDSLTSWLSRKEKHSIPVRNRLPVYIRYFTCEGKNGRVTF